MASDILVNYKAGDAAATAGRAVIVIVVFSTYAICQFVGRYVAVVNLYIAEFLKNKIMFAAYVNAGVW